MSPELPKYEPHSQTRSRTFAERNAERRAIFAENQRAREAAQAAKNAEVRAGTGITKVGNMLSTDGSGKRLSGTIVISGNLNGEPATATVYGTID